MQVQRDITAWLLALSLLISCSPGLDPRNNLESGSASNSTVAAGNPSFFAIQSQILVPMCSSCHSSSSASGGFGVDSYQDVVAFVNAGSPQNSELYYVLETQKMPPTGQAVSAAQINQIAQWIQAGAPNN